jgi:hypothetical protein
MERIAPYARMKERSYEVALQEALEQAAQAGIAQIPNSL